MKSDPGAGSAKVATFDSRSRGHPIAGACVDDSPRCHLFLTMASAHSQVLAHVKYSNLCIALTFASAGIFQGPGLMNAAGTLYFEPGGVLFGVCPMASPISNDKKFLCPICGEVVLTLSAASAAFASRAISDLTCPNGHRLGITPKGKVVVTR